MYRETARNSCGEGKEIEGSEKHARWRNNEVKAAVRRKSYLQKVT